MRPLSFSDRYWFVKLTMALALVAVVVVVLLSTKGCAQKPHTHDDGEIVVVKEATCTNSGLQYKKCKGCGEQLGYENLPALGHSYVNKEQQITKPTCAKEGSRKLWEQCENCGQKKNEKTEPVPATGAHKYPSTWTKVDEKPAFCQKDGYRDEIRYCTTCPSDDRASETRRVTIPAKEHDYQDFEAVYYNNQICIKATCSRDCNESNEVYYFTEQNGVKITRDENYALCCIAPYTVEMVYNNEKLSFTFMSKEVPTESHTINHNGQQIEVNTLMTNGYFDYSNPIVAQHMVVLGEWGENGMANGVYTCTTCNAIHCEGCSGLGWVNVMLYNPEYDTTK